MRLVLISPPEPHLPAEAELLSAMFDRGLQQYHLRKPGCTWSQVRPLLERLKPEHRKRTMVHQHHAEATREFAVRVSLAVGTPSPAPQWIPCCALPVDGRRPSPIPPRRGASAGALQGLHYPARLRPAPPLPALQGLLQSTSLHSLEELLVGWGPYLDYGFLSPIFDSISKRGYQAAGFDRARLRQLLGACPLEVVALGGITPGRVREARELGFGGVAVIGSVWGAPDPVEAFLELQAACEACSS